MIGRKRIGRGQPDHIDQLYDSFKKKDLTRRQFRRAYKRVLSEKRSRKDLESMLLSLEIEKQQRERINRRIANGR